MEEENFNQRLPKSTQGKKLKKKSKRVPESAQTTVAPPPPPANTANTANFQRSAVNSEQFFELSEPKRKLITELTMQIGRAPCACPFNDCDMVVSPSYMLNHILSQHLIRMAGKCTEISINRGAIIPINPLDITVPGCSCLAVTAYAGLQNNIMTRPGVRALCLKNSGLSRSYEHLLYHFPICLVNVNRDQSDNGSGSGSGWETNNVGMLLIGSETTKPIRCSLSLLNSEMTMSMTKLMETKLLADVVKYQKFGKNDFHIMRVTMVELNALTSNGTKPMLVEITVHDDELIEK